MGRLSNKIYKELYDDINLSPNPDYLQEKYGKDPLTLISLFRKWVKGKHGFDLSPLRQYEDEHHEPLLECLYRCHAELMGEELAANGKNYALLFSTFYERDAQERKRVLDYEKERRKRPDVKRELDDYWTKRRKRPKVKKMRARQAREYYQDPVAREATKEKRKVYSSQQAQRNRERGKVISNIIKRMYKGQAYIVQFSKESGVNHKSLRKIAIGYIECRLEELEKSVEFMIRKGEDVMPILLLLETMGSKAAATTAMSLRKTAKHFQRKAVLQPSRQPTEMQKRKRYSDEELAEELRKLTIEARYVGDNQIKWLSDDLYEYYKEKSFEGLGNNHFWIFDIHNILDGLDSRPEFIAFILSYYEQKKGLDTSNARRLLKEKVRSRFHGRSSPSDYIKQNHES